MKRSILLVDDEPGVLLALKYTLRRDGYHLVTATDATAALSLIESVHFDAVLCDHGLPGMSGLEFLCEAKKLRPEMLRVLITGNPDIDVAVEAVARGEICRYLAKPWDDVDLRITMSLIFAQNQQSARARAPKAEQRHDAQ